MALTPEVEAEIIAVYRQTRSPFKTHRRVGVSIDEVFTVINSNEDKLSAQQERNGGYGQPELRHALVARRSVSDRGWDNFDPAVIAAREAYEAGTHIMATGRDGSWLLLYSIPRKGKPDPQPGYFLPEVC